MFKNRLITFAAPLVVATTLGVLWIATISLAEIVISKAVQRQAAAQASSSALSSVTDLNRAEWLAAELVTKTNQLGRAR